MSDQPGDGILLVSKPVGITSHDVVERVRVSLPGRVKVGHAGTLDPFASGLLIVLVGRATRAQRYLMALPKEYRARARFGFRSDTGDPTGEVVATGGHASEDAVRAALPQLTGEIRQRVPLTSAVKVGGERLYRKARRGEQFEAPVRTVNVSRLALTEFDEAKQTGVLEIECSSGTYVRRLAIDLGELCGAGAYCEALERVAIGRFRLEDADDDRLIPLARALDFLPARVLDEDEARRVRNGAAVPDGDRADGGAPVIVRLMAGDELIALAERRDDVLKPVTVLSPS
jgi:tRNA pseudouridine55 synthase